MTSGEASAGGKSAPRDQIGDGPCRSERPQTPRRGTQLPKGPDRRSRESLTAVPTSQKMVAPDPEVPLSNSQVHRNDAQDDSERKGAREQLSTSHYL